MNKRYKVGAYLRLSKKDDEIDVSNSIINQKTLIDNYIKINVELELVDYYIDDGYSGTTFERTLFLKLIEGINSK